MKRCFFIFALILSVFSLISCAGSSGHATTEEEKPLILDSIHKSFYVNGISAAEGKTKIVESLEAIGFKVDGEITECDLTYIGEGYTYYANWRAKSLTVEQVNTLSYGLFKDLLETQQFYKIIEDNVLGYRVFLSWYKSGQLKKATIEIGDYFGQLPEPDAIKINNKLSELFPHSKIGNKREGYMTYFDDNGVDLYYTNGFVLQLEKK